ncbi:MAG: hypothetical protein ACEPOV_04445 [Hyphomicrobiales bacterium]
MKRFTIFSLFIILSVLTSCKKDKETPEREDNNILREVSGETITRYEYNSGKLKSIFTTMNYIFSYNGNYPNDYLQGNYGPVKATFSYDGNGRVQEVVIKPINRDYDDVKEVRHYEYYADVIKVRVVEEIKDDTYEGSIYYYINSSESFLEKIQVERGNEEYLLEFVWENDNIVEICRDGKYVVHYAFDNKKSPYKKIFSKNCIFSFNQNIVEICSKNNVISTFDDYEYNNEGYPTQRKKTTENGHVYIENYVYK